MSGGRAEVNWVGELGIEGEKLEIAWLVTGRQEESAGGFWRVMVQRGKESLSLKRRR